MRRMENISYWIRWICAPTGVTILQGFCLFLMSIVLVAFMGAYFYGVIDDNAAISENPISKMLNDASSFTKQLRHNVSGIELLNDFQWLHHFETLLKANCNIISLNLKRLRYTGYVMAIYNTILMHVLLNGVLPVSLTSCISIFASIASNYIDQSTIILLGIFEFGQIFLSVMIFGTFVALKEQINSHRRHDNYDE